MDTMDIERWKIKKLVKSLDSARGDGTSMVTLVLQGHEPLHRASQMLTEEMGTATNIKSRVNRLSVLSALTSIQQRLKLYHSTPDLPTHNTLYLFHFYYCSTFINSSVLNFLIYTPSAKRLSYGYSVLLSPLG